MKQFKAPKFIVMIITVLVSFAASIDTATTPGSLNPFKTSIPGIIEKKYSIDYFTQIVTEASRGNMTNWDATIRVSYQDYVACVRDNVNDPRFNKTGSLYDDGDIVWMLSHGKLRTRRLNVGDIIFGVRPDGTIGFYRVETAVDEAVLVFVTNDGIEIDLIVWSCFNPKQADRTQVEITPVQVNKTETTRGDIYTTNNYYYDDHSVVENSWVDYGQQQSQMGYYAVPTGGSYGNYFQACGIQPSYGYTCDNGQRYQCYPVTASTTTIINNSTNVTNINNNTTNIAINITEVNTTTRPGTTVTPTNTGGSGDNAVASGGGGDLPGATNSGNYGGNGNSADNNGGGGTTADNSGGEGSKLKHISNPAVTASSRPIDKATAQNVGLDAKAANGLQKNTGTDRALAVGSTTKASIDRNVAGNRAGNGTERNNTGTESPAPRATPTKDIPWSKDVDQGKTYVAQRAQEAKDNNPQGKNTNRPIDKPLQQQNKPIGDRPYQRPVNSPQSAHTNDQQPVKQRGGSNSQPIRDNNRSDQPQAPERQQRGQQQPVRSTDQPSHAGSARGTTMPVQQGSRPVTTRSAPPAQHTAPVQHQPAQQHTAPVQHQSRPAAPSGGPRGKH